MVVPTRGWYSAGLLIKGESGWAKEWIRRDGEIGRGEIREGE